MDAFEYRVQKQTVRRYSEDEIKGFYRIEGGLKCIINTSNLENFGYRRYRFSSVVSAKNLPRISSAFLCDLSANFSETNGRGASLEKYEVEKCVADSKDYAQAEGLLSPNNYSNLMKLVSFGRKCRRGRSLHRRKRNCQNINLRKIV
ncbi:hypothetical protein AVEN_81706-1 [Araneus ventricosus]|uniref:Uncharacterized protein n=1 Tax=Araneus ventricosus TaxID=182803 RepID=A0A4Y2IBC8_ARAVE|nr:hypothetical protein AVEN_81706-1 [Araneus ventricosus]